MAPEDPTGAPPVALLLPQTKVEAAQKVHVFWTFLLWDLLHGEPAVLWSKVLLTAETEISANSRALMAGQGK